MKYDTESGRYIYIYTHRAFLGDLDERTKNKEQRTKNKEQRTKNKEQRTKNETYPDTSLSSLIDLLILGVGYTIITMATSTKYVGEGGGGGHYSM